MFEGEFKGKVGLLFGCSRISGKYIARTFMREGMITVVASRSKEVVDIYEELKQEFPDSEGYAVSVDFGKEAEVKAFIDSVVEKYGRIDVISYHAAYLSPLGSMEETTEEELDKSIGANYKGPYFVIKHAAPTMKKQRSGSIVVTSSWYARKGVPLFAPYCTTKAAASAIVQCAGLELAPYGVRVNSFAPGDIANEKHFNAVRDEAIIRGISYEEMDKIVADAIPMKKRLDPAKMGDIILFLSSDAADHITATNLNVSGGSEFR